MAMKTATKLAATQKQSSVQQLEVLLLALGTIAAIPPVHADSFVIANGQTVTDTQFLGDNETGTVQAGGTISTIGDGVRGISSSGNSATITNNGIINASIWSRGADAKISNSGTINMTEGGASAISSTGKNATITNSGNIISEIGKGIYSNGSLVINSGTISTAEGGREGIFSSYGNVINSGSVIINSGTINTAAVNAYGIYVEGNDVTLTNSGSINTAGNGAHGIESYDQGATIKSSGIISTQGIGAYGINSHGGSAAITNSGTISTSAADASGIVSRGDSATISNVYTINTKGSGGLGILSSGDSATITNSGVISTAGDLTTENNLNEVGEVISITFHKVNGIDSEGAHATISNSGKISTTGISGSGIASSGVSATITNGGKISTTGQNATGIISTGDSATITNSGTIDTKARGSFGIFTNGDSASVTNKGTISTKERGAFGISSFGANASITNSGLISATSNSSFAILGNDRTSQTLNILPGSRIVGAIDLGGGGDTVNLYGSYGSAVLTFANPNTINVLTANAVKVGGGTVVVIDPTGESSRAQSLSALSSGIHQVISQRQQGVPAMNAVKVAALDLTPGMLNLDTAPLAWGQVFGSQSRKDGDGQMLGFEHRYAGLMGGYEQAHHGDRVGLVAGVANGNTSSPMSGMNSDSVFAGLYRHSRLGELNLTGSLVAGVERHTSQRTVLDNLNRTQTARGSTTSYYLSPSLSIGRSYAVAPAWMLRPSAVLGYSVGWYDGYTESGTTNANLHLGARTVQALTGRAQLELARQTGWGEASVRAGVQMRQTSQGAVRGTVSGSDFRFSAMGDKNASGGYVGLGVQKLLKDRLSLEADVEVGQLSGGEKQLAARVTLQYVF